MSKTAVSRPRVYIRIRPLNERETKEGKGEMIAHGDQRQKDVLFFKREEREPEMQVRFDHIFDRTDTQENVFDLIGPEVQRTLFSGYNASIFAYGQTGSGKTHTMEGDKAKGGVRDPNAGGLIPRVIRSIFEQFSSNKDISDAVVEMSLVQIYQEKIQDLFQNLKQLDIHMDKTGDYVARDAAWKKVKNLEDCMDLYAEASKKRATSATEMNLVSSRSHMILMLKLQWDEPTLPGSRAQLNLIDLAGSERLDESGATGNTMKEAIHINKSLSALGNVVTKLVEQAKHPNRRTHVPYKDSKLTYLLQSSLGGANLVHFMLAISSSAMWRSETISTIEFGKRALQLVLRPVRNAIDYTRLAEMEAMIENMRSHIQSLEEELQHRASLADGGANFLQIQRIAQDEDDRRAHRRGERTRTRKHLKRQTELSRIMANLPETFDDLTSHCVLFPESKGTFRELGGLEKLIHFVEKSASTFYRSNAAQTIASVIDEKGRNIFAELDGVAALTRLLQVKEERCKEAACVALEAVCRGCRKNKEALAPVVYDELVDLIYGYPNQQVQEAACAAVASIVDGFPEATRRFEKLEVVPKLLETIRITPEEVVNLTKAATNCVGRLAHGDTRMQQLIASLGGIDLLIDVLFSPGGDRDHQVPILASYALVNLCCSSAENLTMAKEHPRYFEVKFRLLEGLARAFGINTAREGFGRATAQETALPFPYFGVTVQDEWTASSSGGRPIFSSFMDNPQFYLKVSGDGPTDVAFIIQDTLYEMRMRKKRKNNAVYMGIAIFEGDADLSKEGLKQLDFHGRMVEIGKYTSNCENVLHCTLSPSDTPYVVVPFTSQRGRKTNFALTAFADRPLELTTVPDQMGWVHTVLDGNWSEFTGRSGEGFDWRSNPQIRLNPKVDCRVVFVLSYLSLDQQRALLKQQEEEDEELNTRPRLHGRLFTNEFASLKRYLKALVPLPQGSTFVASNAFASNSYITTSGLLKAGEPYVYIPFTETPHQDTWRVSVYCDTDDIAISPLASTANEWLCSSFASTWHGTPVTVTTELDGRLVAVANSPGCFLRVRLLNSKGKKVGGIDSYWNSEAAVEFKTEKRQAVTVQVEGVMRSEAGAKGQEPARDRKFDLFLFTEEACPVKQLSFEASPSAWAVPMQSTSLNVLQYPRVVEEGDANQGVVVVDDDNASGSENDEEIEELLEDLEKKEEENRQLAEQLARQQDELQALRSGQPVAAAASSTQLRPVTPADKPTGSSHDEAVAGGGGQAPFTRSAKQGTSRSSLVPEPPSERRSSATPARRGSSSGTKKGSRRGSGSSSQSGKAPRAPSSSTNAVAVQEMRGSVEQSLLKLNALHKRLGAAASKDASLAAYQREIEDIQDNLFTALNRRAS